MSKKTPFSKTSQNIGFKVTLHRLLLFTMENNDFRVLIRHYFLMGKNTIDENQWLDKAPAYSKGHDVFIFFL